MPTYRCQRARVVIEPVSLARAILCVSGLAGRHLAVCFAILNALLEAGAGELRFMLVLYGRKRSLNGRLQRRSVLLLCAGVALQDFETACAICTSIGSSSGCGFGSAPISGWLAFAPSPC